MVQTQNKRTTMAITADRKFQLEQIAIKRSVIAGRIFSWTDIVNELIDELLIKELGEEQGNDKKICPDLSATPDFHEGDK